MPNRHLSDKYHVHTRHMYIHQTLTDKRLLGIDRCLVDHLEGIWHSSDNHLTRSTRQIATDWWKWWCMDLPQKLRNMTSRNMMCGFKIGLICVCVSVCLSVRVGISIHISKLIYQIGRYIDYYSNIEYQYRMASIWYKYRISANDKISDIRWAKILNIGIGWHSTDIWYVIYMKTPACRTSRESMGVQKSPNNFDLNLMTLTYDLWPMTFDLGDLDPCDLGPSFLKLDWKLEFLHFWPWWPWPLTNDLDLQTCPRYDGP